MAAFDEAWKEYNGDKNRCYATAWSAVNKYEEKASKNYLKVEKFLFNYR
jgi:hypothetical protein